MKKYRELRDILMEVMSDKEWHTSDELQKKCEAHGMTFDGGRGPIYNIMHQFKKVGIVETDGTGRYRLSSNDAWTKDEKTNQKSTCELNRELAESISKIEIQLSKYKKFNWINCSEKELQDARCIANQLITLAEKIKKELGTL